MEPRLRDNVVMSGTWTHCLDKPFLCGGESHMLSHEIAVLAFIWLRHLRDGLRAAKK